jgi:hypothetical protein
MNRLWTQEQFDWWADRIFATLMGTMLGAGFVFFEVNAYLTVFLTAWWAADTSWNAKR